MVNELSDPADIIPFNVAEATVILPWDQGTVTVGKPVMAWAIALLI